MSYAISKTVASLDKLSAMAKKINLSINEPCHENWNKMAPVEQGKFCNACQKQVIDFTGMSDQQLVAFFRKPPAGSVCGRFQNDQLNRDLEIPRKRIPWVKYFFQFTLPAFLIIMKGSSALAQKGKVKIEATPERILGKIAPVCSNNTNNIDTTTDLQISKKINEIKGRVVDENDNPVAYATIAIKGKKIGVSSDSAGRFSIKAADYFNNVTLVVSCVGFVSNEVVFDDKTYNGNIILRLNTAITGEVVIVGFITPVTKRKKQISIIKNLFSDTAFNQFKVFPNPAIAGSVVSVEWKNIKPGDYILEILNQTGQVVYDRQITVVKNNLFTTQLPFIASGSYFLRVINRTSKKAYSEKIIIH